MATLERALSLLATRAVRREYIERAVARAGLSLSARAAWLLVRLERDPALDLVALAHAHRADPERLEVAAAELRQRGLVEDRPAPDGGRPRRELTRDGCDALTRLVGARRALLTEVLEDWAPEKREELAEVVQRFSRELVPDPAPYSA